MIKFEYSKVRVENDPANLWSVDFDMDYDGDTYQVAYEYSDDEGYSTIVVTLENVDQYWETDGGMFDSGEKETHISKTIESEELSDWIRNEIINPIWEAQRNAIIAMQGKSGTVKWEDIA